MNHSDLQRPQPFDRARFWRLIAGYLFGVAVGCILVGMILSAKRRYLAPPSTPADAQTPAQVAPPAPEQPAAPSP